MCVKIAVDHKQVFSIKGSVQNSLILEDKIDWTSQQLDTKTMQEMKCKKMKQGDRN